MNMPKFENIVFFVEVYRAKSITKAASNLFITQQSLSHSIKRLEEDLGQELFFRTVRGVQPTKAGNRLYMTFSPIIFSYQNAMQHYESKYVKNSISFAITPAVIRNLTPNLLLSFCKSYPETTIEMVAAHDIDLERFVREDKSRFGLISAPEWILGERYEYIALKTEPIFLLVHNDNPISKMSCALSALRNERFLGLKGGRYFLEAINKVTESYGFSVSPYFESDDIVNLFNMVECGTGVMLCRDSLFREVQLKNCTLVPLSDHTLDACTAFVFQDYFMLPELAKRYVSFLQQSLKN